MVTIKLRRGTSAEWIAENPVLANGEVGVESSYGVIPDRGKIGDGATAWNSLPYSIGSDWVALAEKGVAGGVATLDETGVVPVAQIPSGAAFDAEVTAAIDAHAGLTDPHTGYQKESDLFDAGAPPMIEFGLLGSAGSATTAAKRDHIHPVVANPVTAHESAADPHPGYVLESLIDAAGDLIVGTADNTVGRLAKGSALDVLRVNAGATALEFAAPSGGSGSSDETLYWTLAGGI